MATSEAISTEKHLNPTSHEVDQGLKIVELLFFAYRDFISDPDAILGDLDFGRAHHRVIHFVGSRPGMSVADLLETLQITKQSLARVLKQLIDNSYIRQATGLNDRRQRRLYLTPEGEQLRRQLLSPQLNRVAKALDTMPQSERCVVAQFLTKMCNNDHQDTSKTQLSSLLKEGDQRGSR